MTNPSSFSVCVPLLLGLAVAACGEVEVASDASTADAATGFDAAPGDPDAKLAPDAEPAADAEPADDMITIPVGPFTMGCGVAGRFCPNQEMPVHSVTLSAFEIDRTEVTQADYQDCIDDMVCSAPLLGFDPASTPNHPVRGISWLQAAQFCGWKGKRLPTEAEWEKAARGTDARGYPWGDTAADCTLAHYDECPNSDGPTEVGQHPAGASFYGVEDMAGNVEEWVNDWYSETYYENSPASDPTGPATGTFKVARGGSYGLPIISALTYRRAPRTPTDQTEYSGVRCAQ